MKKSIKSNRTDYFLVTTFILTATLVMYMIAGVYPFGNLAIEYSDLASCYIQQVQEVKSFLLSGDWKSMLHSWNRIDGSTPLAMANLGILFNPLALLYLIVPYSKVSEITVVYLTLKYIMAGCTFLFMLKKLFHMRSDTAIQIALSVTWGLNVYLVSHNFLIIWTDFMVLLPLMIVLVYRYVAEPKHVGCLFCIVLYLFLLNFYYAYIFIGFSFCFLTTVIIQRNKTFKEGIRLVSWYIVVHILALIPSLPVLYPSLKILLGTDTNTASLPFGMVQPFSLLFAKLVTPYYNGHLSKESLAIFIGCAALITLCLIALSLSKNAKEKIIDMAFILFMLLSFLLNPLYFIWHAFDEPNGFPGRMGYCLIFLVLWVIYKHYPTIEFSERNKNKFFGTTFVILISVLLCHLKYTTLHYTILLSTTALILCTLFYKIKINKAFPILVSLEMVIASIFIFSMTYSGNTLQDINAITNHRVSLANKVNTLKEMDPPDKTFYRTTLLDSNTLDINWGIMYDMKSVTGFNNIYNKAFAKSTNLLFSGKSESNAVIINDTTPFTEFMLGIKYAIPSTDNQEPIQLQEKAVLGFAIKEPITEEDLSDTLGGTINQNTVIQKMTGLNLPIFEVVNDLSPTNPYTTQFETVPNEKYYAFSYIKSPRNTPNRYLDGKLYSPTTVGLIELIGDGKEKVYTLDSSKIQEAPKNSAKIEAEIDLNVYHFLQKNYEKHVNLLERQILKVTNFDDFSIDATINIDKDGTLVYISLPNSNYAVFSGNKELVIEEPIPGYLGVRLDKGFHEIKIIYQYF